MVARETRDTPSRTVTHLGRALLCVCTVGRMVLTRNGQPLAAMQYQGRLLDTWNEIIYDGRGYRLSHVKGKGRARPNVHILVNEVGDHGAALGVFRRQLGQSRQLEIEGHKKTAAAFPL